MASHFDGPKSYEQALSILGSRDECKLPGSNNVRLIRRRDANYIAVRLHSTDVVTFHANGTITLRHGGHQTVTTKRIMDGCLPRPWYVFQKGSDKRTRQGGFHIGVYDDVTDWNNGYLQIQDGKLYDELGNVVLYA